MPIISGNVSLYNETADGPIVPAPLVGMVGLLEDRSNAVPMRWSHGDEIYLLGEPAWEPSSLAGSEHAWRRGYMMLVNVSAVADAHERLWMPEGAFRPVRLLFDLPAPVLDVFSHI